jgi:putative resolvase
VDKFISIKEASELVGVTTTTLRRWEQNGLFCPNHRTFGNHRRYELESVLKLINKNKETEQVTKKTICYSRVSTHDQKEDLTRQAKVLEIYSKEHDLQNVEYINDIGSGLNYKKKGLTKLLKLILNNQIDTLVLTHKDRLLRFGSDLLINVANHFNVKTIILNDKKSTFEEELANDVLEIITVFSSKLYGSRSHKNKKSCNKD